LEERGVPVVGIPATIDNDVWGTDTAIGVDTALNTALDAIDRIKDTASSHQRAHIVEVMGRNCGYLALMSAIAGGAEAVLIPEFAPRPEEIMRAFQRSWEQGKPHFIVVAAEGAPLSAEELSRASQCLDTSSAAGAPPPSTGYWPAAWEPPRSRRSPKESQG
jgi:6-phosphofructokinase 1